jgi:hypothetical protein
MPRNATIITSSICELLRLGYLNKKEAINKMDQLLLILKESNLKKDKILKIKQEIINTN